MNCNFDKFKNLLGVYRVVIDSVIDSHPDLLSNKQLTESQKHTINSEIVKNLTREFESYELQIVGQDADIFLVEASYAIEDALDMVLNELTDLGANATSFMFAPETYVQRIFNPTNFKKINYVVEKQSSGYEAKNASQLKDGLLHSTGVVNIRSINKKELLQGGSLQVRLGYNNSMSNTITDLIPFYYGTANSVHNRAKNNFLRRVFQIRFGQIHTVNKGERINKLNESLNGFKQNLLEVVLQDPIFNNKSFTLETLPKVISLYESKLNKLNGGDGLFAEDLINWSLNSVDTIDRYNAYVQLKNFDGVLEKYAGSLISVHEDLKGIYTTENKYLFADTNNLRSSWSSDQEEIVSADSETSDLYKNYIQTIEKIDRNGNIIIQDYLSTESINYTVSKFRANLLESQPVSSIKKQLEDFLENFLKSDQFVYQNNYTDTDFKNLMAMYANVYRTGETVHGKTQLNKVLSKIDKLNSVDSLNNIFSRFTTQNGDLNMVEVVSSNLMKVDHLSYTETVYDYKNRTYKTVPMRTKLSDSQYFRLKVLGNKVVSKTKSAYDKLKEAYQFDVVKKPGRDKYMVEMTLADNSVIYYDPTGEQNFYKINNGKWEIFDLKTLIPSRSLDTAMAFNEYRNANSNYADFIERFDKLLEQPLSIDDYRMLNVMKEYSGDGHIEVIGKLMGNFMFLTKLNTDSIDGDWKQTQDEIINSISRSDLLVNTGLDAKDIWDHKYRRFNIDLSSGSLESGALRDYANASNIYNRTDIRAVTKNLEGKMLPTAAINNPINNFHVNLRQVKKERNKSALRNNLFVNVDDLISGVEIRSSIKNKDGEVMHPSDMNTKELLKNSILVEFLANRVNTDNNSDQLDVRFQPTNYADKQRVSLLAVNSKAKVNINGTVKSWSELTVLDLQSLYFDAMSDYYENVGSKVLEDFRKVFDGGYMLEAFINNSKLLNKVIEAYPELELADLIKNKNIPQEFVGETLRKELDIANALSKIAWVKNEKGQLSNLTSNFKKLEGILPKLDIDTITDAFNNSGLLWYNNLYFEKNSSGVASLNTSLLHYVEYYKNKNAAVKSIEEDFIKKLQEEEFSIDMYTPDLQRDQNIKKAYRLYGLTAGLDQFVDTDRKVINNFIEKDGEKVLNPILKDYLWQNLNVSRNFQLLTVGSVLGHPHKIKNKTASLNQIIAGRLIQQNKRMVKHQATYHAYLQDTIGGVLHKENIIYLQDPSVLSYTPNGHIDSVDVADGASIITPLEANILNNSLLDQSVGLAHKSIGGVVDPIIGAAGLKKHAALTITNLDIQNSPKYQEIVAKMLGRNFNNFKGVQIEVDITKDYNGRKINLLEAFDEVSFKSTDKHGLQEFIDNGRFVTLLDIDNISGNVYEFTYREKDPDATPFKVQKQINTLHDLWVVLGAETSVQRDLLENSVFRNHNNEFFSYLTSNTSWDALTYFTNNVGFWNTNEAHPTAKTFANATANPKGLFKAYNDYLPNGLNKTEAKPSNDPTSQTNIFQPLKHSNIGMITFASGQKVGVPNGMSMDYFLSKDVNDINVSGFDVSQYGIQLNADHQVDGSKVTEPTQIMATLSFSGDTAGIAHEVFKGVTGYINENLIDTINLASTKVLSPHQKTLLRQLIKNQTLKAFKNQDLSGLSNSIIQALQEEDATGITTNLQIPVSSPDMHSMLNTSISNFFTNEGVRRKMAGVAAVAKPYSGFIKFRSVPDGKGGIQTMTESKYQEWLTKNQSFNPLQPLNSVNDIELFSTVLDLGGSKIKMNPSNYVNFKLHKSLQFNDVITGYPADRGYRVNLTAERDLTPPGHTWELEGVSGKFTYYDNASSAIHFVKNELNKAIEEYQNKLEELNYNFSVYENSIFAAKNMGETAELRAANAKIKLEVAINNYNSILNRINTSEFLNNVIVSAQSDLAIRPYDFNLVNTPDQLKSVKFNEQQINLIKNLMNERLGDIKNKMFAPIPFHIKSINEIATAITNYGDTALENFNNYISVNENGTFESWILERSPSLKVAKLNKILGEVAIAFPHKTAFGLSEDQDVSDVTPDFFRRQYDANILSPVLHMSDFYLKGENGKHVHFLMKGSKNYTKFINRKDKTQIKLNTKTIDGVMYAVDAYGKLGAITPSETIYKIRHMGREHSFITIDQDSNQVADIFTNYVSTKLKRTPYSELIPNLNDDINNLQIFVDLQKEQGIDIGYSEDIDQIAEIVEELTTNRKKARNLNLEIELDVKKKAEILKKIRGVKWASEQIKTFKNELINSELFEEALVEYNNKISLLNNYMAALSTNNDEAIIDILTQYDSMTEQDRAYLHLLNNVVKNKLNGPLFQILTTIQKKRIDKIKSKSAASGRNKYNNFVKALENIGARIPGQDNQSFMAMKVAHFLNGQLNTVYVSPEHQNMTGEDFDIDKVFMLFRMVNKEGFITPWTKYWNSDSLNQLDTSLDAPVADLETRSFKVSLDDNSDLNRQDLQFLTDLSNARALILKDLKTKRGDKFKESDYKKAIARHITKDPISFKRYIDIINKTSLFTQISLNEELYSEFASSSKAVIDVINEYFLEKPDGGNIENAMLNVIVNGLINHISDVRNVTSAYSPMTFGEFGRLASEPDSQGNTTRKNEQMLELNPENPVDIARAQSANMVGRVGIGITASSGLKVYSLIGNALTKVKLGEKGFYMGSIELPKYDERTDTFSSYTSDGFKGVNFSKSPEKYVAWVKRNNPGSDLTIEKFLTEHYTRGSVSLTLSALLAAATDNAKELILDRINANPDTLGLYIAAIDLGVDAKTIVKLMTHSTTEKVLSLTKGDFFRSESVRFNNAIGYLKKGYVPALMFMNLDQAYNIMKEFEKDSNFWNDFETRYKNYVKTNNLTEDEIIPMDELKNSDLETFGLMTLLYSNEELTGEGGFITKVIEKPTLDAAPINKRERATKLKRIRYDSDELFDDRGFEDIDSDYQEDMDLDVSDLEFESVIDDFDASEYGMGQLVKQDTPLKASFLKYVDFNNKKLSGKTDKNILNFLSELQKIKEDIELLAKIASINQGVQNTTFDLYNFINAITSYIRDNVEPTYSKFKDGFDKVSDSTLITEVFENSEFTEFLVNDAKFKEGATSSINLINILYQAQHTWSMLKLAAASFNVHDKMSVKNRLSHDILAKSEVPVTRKNFPIVKNYIDNVFLSTAINNMSELELTFNIPKGDVVDPAVEHLQDENIKLNNVDGRDKFINWMENTVIPNYLKLGMSRDVFGNTVMENGKYRVDPKIVNNLFIQLLSTDQRIISQQEMFTYYRIPLDLVNVKSNDQAVLIDALKTSFSQLENVSFQGKKLTDLFFLYNLIVNKGKVNATSFTPLIDGIFDYKKNNLISNYSRIIGEMDTNDTYRINVDEAMLAELYGQGLAIKKVRLPKLTAKAGTEIDLTNIPKAVSIRELSPDVENEWVDKVYIRMDRTDQGLGHVWEPYNKLRTSKSLNVMGGDSKNDVIQQKAIVNRSKDNIMHFVNSNLKIEFKKC